MKSYIGRDETLECGLPITSRQPKGQNWDWTRRYGYFWNCRWRTEVGQRFVQESSRRNNILQTREHRELDKNLAEIPGNRNYTKGSRHHGTRTAQATIPKLFRPRTISFQASRQGWSRESFTRWNWAKSPVGRVPWIVYMNTQRTRSYFLSSSIGILVDRNICRCEEIHSDMWHL